MTDFGNRLNTIHPDLKSITILARGEEHNNALLDEHTQVWTEMMNRFLNMYNELCSVGPFAYGPLSVVRDDVTLFGNNHLTTNYEYNQFVIEINHLLDLYNQDRDEILRNGKI